MSDKALVDVAPSPPRTRFQAGGQRVVGFLVMRPGVLARRVAGTGHPAAGQADREGRRAVRGFPAAGAVSRAGRDRLEPVEVFAARRRAVQADGGRAWGQVLGGDQDSPSYRDADAGSGPAGFTGKSTPIAARRKRPT